ncbi:cation-translocating P-type ATPase [Halorubellus sp. PRR65]|uniref:heavy metal translocating P-type ATPase n=1 Tax=Halorubellus sp. PRR65 TaxID=3098148 RepID=UPI002B258C09|nr:cation-translocating P-type ATPase [Halorubellus sp. PRR65]
MSETTPSGRDAVEDAAAGRGAADANACTLCGLDVPDPPVSGSDGTYCCAGCKQVHETVGDVDVDGPVDSGDVASALGPPGSADGDATGTADAVEEGDADAEAYLRVDGMHCTTCETFVEGVAEREPGVAAADASYGSRLVRVAYDSGALAADALPDRLTGYGYRARSMDDAEDGERSSGRLIVGGFFGMMTMLWYVLFLYPDYLGWDVSFLDVSGSAGAYLLANVWVMATIVLAYTGYPILRGAYVSLAAGKPNMDLLVSLAAVNAYVYSTAALLVGRTEVYFDVTVAIVLVVSIGTYLERRATDRAADRVGELAEERVTEATVRADDGSTETVPVDAVTGEDAVVVGQSDRVPLDGTVVEGEAAVDESLLTGESNPVAKSPGDRVVGGSTVVDGGVVVEPDPDTASTLDRLVETTWNLAASRSGAQRLADKLAAVFVPLVVTAAVLATAYWLVATGDVANALLTGLAVLVVSCPCALGLATPLAVASAVSRGLDRGVVVRDASVFERAPEVDTVVFDKTGTLTTGEMTVDRVVAGEDATDAGVLASAAALETYADHPVAEAIVDRAGSTSEVGAVPSASGIDRRPGRGVTGRVDGERVLVGNRELLAEHDVAVPSALRDAAATARDDGALPVFVARDEAVRGVVVVHDDPRPGWERACERLSADGRDVVVLTGDDRAAASRFERHDAVSEVYADVRPESKTEIVRTLATDAAVAMVGDGSNDAGALATADVGVAMGSGTALAADAADAVVVDDDLDSVGTVFDLATTAHGRVRGNLAWAFGYNAVAIPVAIAGLLNPLIAAVAMTASSLLVVANTRRDWGLDDAADAPADAPDSDAATADPAEVGAA